MAKIPGTHRHASIASIPHRKEYKEGHERTFDQKKAARNSDACQAVKYDVRGRQLYCDALKYHLGDHNWKFVEVDE